MTQPLPLCFWLLVFIAALFFLATDVWAGTPCSALAFIGAALLGVLGPSATWVITRRYPETDQLAWPILGITAAGVLVELGAHVLDLT